MTYAFADGFVMLAELLLKPGKRDAFLDYTMQNREISRSAAGNIAFDILVDQQHPDRVIFYEIWESVEAQRAYMAWRVERGDLATLLSFLAVEPKFAALRQVEDKTNDTPATA